MVSIFCVSKRCCKDTALGVESLVGDEWVAGSFCLELTHVEPLLLGPLREGGIVWGSVLLNVSSVFLANSC